MDIIGDECPKKYSSNQIKKVWNNGFSVEFAYFITLSLLGNNYSTIENRDYITLLFI